MARYAAGVGGLTCEMEAKPTPVSPPEKESSSMKYVGSAVRKMPWLTLEPMPASAASFGDKTFAAELAHPICSREKGWLPVDSGTYVPEMPVPETFDHSVGSEIFS